MLTVRYLTVYGVEALKKNYDIRVKEYPDAYVLNYSGKSPNHAIPNECRGLIVEKPTLPPMHALLDVYGSVENFPPLDPDSLFPDSPPESPPDASNTEKSDAGNVKKRDKGGINVISRSFDRFYDLEQESIPPDQWNQYTVYEKLDGSLIKIYHHKSQWHISTRHTMFAEGSANPTMTFKELCLLALNMTEDHFQSKCQLVLNPKYTYICELVSPDNPIVVRYTTHNLFLLSVRENATGNYIMDENPDFIPRLEPIAFKDLTECLYVLNSKPAVFEGYVFYRKNMPVFKLKSKQYLSFFGIKGASDSEKIKLVLENGLAEYLEKYPEDEYKFEQIHQVIKYIKVDMREKYLAEFASIEDMKEFAKAVYGWDYQHLAITAKKQDISFEEAFDVQKMSYKVKILKKTMEYFNRMNGLMASVPNPNPPLPTSEVDAMDVDTSLESDASPPKQLKPAPHMKICVGMSGSGKSTLAKKLVDEENYLEISRDHFREVLFGDDYKFTRANEKKIEEEVLKTWIEVIKFKPNVIVSDTNLNPKYRQLWVDRALENGYTYEFIPMEISLEDAYKRNIKRGNKALDQNILNLQYARWLDFKRSRGEFPPKYHPKSDTQKVVLCDIDGTVCEINGRGPYEWDKVDTDLPRTEVINLLSAYVRQENLAIIFVSGRSDVSAAKTKLWLETHLPEDVSQRIIALYMRNKKNTYLDDKIHKQQVFMNSIADNYNVLLAIDDRPKIVRLWKDLGIPTVISVQKDYNEF